MSRPSGSSRSKIRSDVQRKLRSAHANLLNLTKKLSQANSPMMKQAGAVLQKHIKKQLSKPASNLRTALKPSADGRRRRYGNPSAPGEAPRKITGALARGVKNKVVEGERQVRAENFKSKIHELGYVAGAQAPRMSRYRGGTRRDGTHGMRKVQHEIKARSARSQAPRPFMRPGMESAKPELAKVGGAVLRDGVRAALAARAGGLSGN